MNMKNQCSKVRALLYAFRYTSDSIIKNKCGDMYAGVVTEYMDLKTVVRALIDNINTQSNNEIDSADDIPPNWKDIITNKEDRCDKHSDSDLLHGLTCTGACGHSMQISIMTRVVIGTSRLIYILEKNCGR